MSKTNRLRFLSFGSACVAVGLVAPQSFSQQNRSLLILTSSTSEVPIEFSKPSSAPKANVPIELKVQPQAATTSDSGDPEVETIRERFPNGRERIERQVALDANGDFKNHGNYQEWTANGDIVATGSFEMGLRQGPWIKMLRSQDAKLFETYPYSKFKSPFQSTVEFAADKMNGVWIITDADNRIISQITLADGIRDGMATWFHPNGKILYQAEYKNGSLDGDFVEKAQDEKMVRNEQYTHGKRIEVEKEYYPSKVLKSEISYLTASPALTSQDDWINTKLAVYDKETEKIKHGSFQSFFDNAQIKSKGTYDLGTLTGDFESNYSNGQKESTGGYLNGKQHGKWTWWHANGMRATVATYTAGQISGEVLAWNDSGKRVIETKGLAQQPPADHDVAVPRQAAKAKTIR